MTSYTCCSLSTDENVLTFSICTMRSLEETVVLLADSRKYDRIQTRSLGNQYRNRQVVNETRRLKYNIGGWPVASNHREVRVGESKLKF